PADDPLPRSGGQLVALELLYDREHADTSFPPGARRDVLPAKQEPHEVAGGDRLDLAPRSGPRVVVDPGQEPPGAELLGAVGRREVAAEGEAFALEPRHRDGGVTLGEPGRLRQLANRRRAPVLEVSSHHLGGGRVPVELSRRERRG